MFGTFPRKKLALSALTGLALLIGANGAMAAQTLRLAHASSSESLINQAMVRFAAQVSEQTKGELKVQLYPDGHPALGEKRAPASADSAKPTGKAKDTRSGPDEDGNIRAFGM